MKIGVVLGRGVEGVGLTKNVVELQRLYPHVEVYATIDKLWGRMNSMDLKVNYFRGADWNSISKSYNDNNTNKIYSRSCRIWKLYNCF